MAWKDRCNDVCIDRETKKSYMYAFIAQLGERQTEDLEVGSSILPEGISFYTPRLCAFSVYRNIYI